MGKQKKTKVVKNQKPTPIKRGRPSKYSEALADKICLAISNSERGLAHHCKENDDFPNPSVVYEWLHEHQDFANKYARAKEAQAEFMADQIIKIADDSSNDSIVTEEGEIENREWVNRSKLRVDARKWIASKLAPKKFGEKIQTEHSGQVAITPITGMKID